jgi:hypothetical protein
MFFKFNSLNLNGNLFYYISYLGNREPWAKHWLEEQHKAGEKCVRIIELKMCDCFGVPVLLQA